MRSLIYTQKIFSNVGLGTFLVLLIPFSSVTQVSSQPSPQFYCFPDPTGNYFTTVSVPNRKPLNVIDWQRKGTDDRHASCIRVSRKFQDFYKAGKLNYIKSGRSEKTGLGIVCGTAEENVECSEKSKLFDVWHYTKPLDSLADDLKKILIDGSGEPIYQGSDDERVINFQEILAQLRTPKK
jgi:Circadian oscillating protein COP23